MRQKYLCIVMVLAVLWLVSPVMGQAPMGTPGKNYILFEYWYNIGGGTVVTDLTGNANYPNNPSTSEWRTSFAITPNLDNYGTRARAYLYPPQTGSYTFWISGDDGCALYLSTDDTSANATSIATVATWTDAQQWTKETNQQSAAIALTAGKKYYIEALQKEGGGGDSLGVAWGGPGIGAGPVLLAGTYCSAFIRDPEPLLMAKNPDPADGAVLLSAAAMLKWTASATAIQHDVYFGADRAAVEAAGLTSPEYKKPRKSKAQTVHPLFTEVLEPGMTYYWRIDEVETGGVIRKGPVWSFKISPLTAWSPTPADGAKFVASTTSLTWQPGLDAGQHDVYFGTDRALVEAGDASVLKAPPLYDTTYQPTGLLPDTTYYWRVDETGAAGLVPGDVWSFTTVVTIPVSDPSLIGWWKMDEGLGLTAVDWSGHGNHGTLTSGPQWTDGYFVDALDFDGTDDFVYIGKNAVELGIDGSKPKTVAAWVYTRAFNNGAIFDSGNRADGQDFCLRTLGSANQWRVQYWGSFDHDFTYTSLNTWVHFALVYDGATSTVYANGQVVSSAARTLATAAANPFQIGRYGWPESFFNGLIDDVRLYNKALTAEEVADIMLGDKALAWNPNPTRSAVVSIYDAMAASWTGGSGAVQHDVYLGTDRMAVKTADTTSPEYKGRQAGTTFNTSALVDMNDSYYWRIDEVSAAGAVTKGSTWSFTIPDYIPIDNIQGYTEDWENLGCIYQAWIDGTGFTTPVDTPGNGSGASVGHPTWDATSAYYNLTTVETGYVHLGSTQSMPLYYFNGGPKSYSEAVRSWTMPQNFTGYGVTDLSLWVHGFSQSSQSITVTENPAGSMSLTGGGEDIWMSRDEFTFAYKTLIGDGSLVARVVSTGTGTNAWAKGGVMIRQSLDGFSTHAMTVITGGNGNGAAFQRRRVYADNVSSPDENTQATAQVNPPYWVKIERFGSEVHGSISPDNVTWTELVVDPPVTIAITDPVLIGLCVTSHARGENRTYQFDNIQSTGTVTGQWQGAIIESPMSNKLASMYVTLTDSMGRSQTIQDTDTDRVNSLRWSQFSIPLSSLTSVDPTRIKKMAIGVDNRANPAAGGNGLVFIDDIRAIKPTPTIAPADSLVADAAGMILSINGLEVSKLVLGTTTFPNLPGPTDPNSQAVKADDFDLKNAASDGTQPYMDVRFAVPVKAILLVENNGNDSGYFQGLDIDGMPTGQMAPYMAWFDYLRTEYRFFLSQQACGIVFTPPAPVYGIRIKGTGTTVGFDGLSISGVPAQ